MKIHQITWSAQSGWTGGPSPTKADWVLYFGDTASLAGQDAWPALRAAFPQALLTGCSTGTYIQNVDLRDQGVAAVAITLEKASLRLASVDVDGGEGSRIWGRTLAERLASPDLVGVFVLSDGLRVNGSELVAGLAEILGDTVAVVGGLAGDGAAFVRTLVGADAAPRESVIAAIGFYGKGLTLRQGSAHGWDFFGPPRRVTKATGAVLEALDGRPPLELYERYLGDEAEDLPGSALLYPLLLQDPKKIDTDMIRTVLSVDRDGGAMTFAGDIPEGWTARLMRGAFGRLIAGAGEAANQARGVDGPPELAIAVSCVGRRLLMGQRAMDEIAAVAEAFETTPLLGFYSYGEIGARRKGGASGLHNQTMTVVTLREDG